VDDRTAAKVHGDKQFSARPYPELAGGYADRIPRRVKRGRNLANDGGVSGILDVEDQDARVNMGTRVQAEVRIGSARIAESATAGAVGAISDVEKAPKNRCCRVHATVK
jgi:hypothetical protein